MANEKINDSVRVYILINVNRTQMIKDIDTFALGSPEGEDETLGFDDGDSVYISRIERQSDEFSAQLE